MKYIFLLILIVSTEGLLGQGFAVVELFTSQGCSSCPAADKNLGQIIQKAEEDGGPIYALSFHVDYWNYIGWKDPYSSKEFTARQNSYGQIMNSNSVYTPQMIINGRTEFVGSNKAMAENEIQAALRLKPEYIITLSDVTLSGDQVHFNYTLDKSPSGESLSVAIVERDVENFVSKGENSGKKLHHENVVRAFKTISLQQRGSVDMKIPQVDFEKVKIIAYIQDKKWHVLAAGAKPIK